LTNFKKSSPLKLLEQMNRNLVGSIYGSFNRGQYFLEINQSETRIACGGHVCQLIGTKLPIFIEDLPTKFRFIWLSGFREEFKKKDQSETGIAYGSHVCRDKISTL
jgi:hypothetical protein